ncbi:MAG: type II toxin-antitoxin system PemK/MazF family toxin [candidate division KSB1 bacterium]|nr:type II toxin-antitoxin system PemK/MazF family toxin [candidate division KSB1 bacterium]MDZ7319523.1 type II toxin-antitoxin system PemK/MazF family toxin [candidate division KSB1 bacterium]MDZ7342803.1 type II toxin-antitoxin system PemK/MazF family toxin [candidate division KSB1 bacterium]
MSSYSKNEVILVRYPFSDFSGSKVRPAVVISAPHSSTDIMIVPLTSKITPLLEGEFILSSWQEAGLNVITAIKRGIYTIDEKLVIKLIGKLDSPDSQKLESSLRDWLALY